MTSLMPPPTSRLRRAVGAVLRSPVGNLADALVGPHGLDRYLELVDPLFARDVNRAVVTDVRRETHDTTTLTLRPARPVDHLAGQFVEVTVEVDGVRHTRCYSISSSAHRGDGKITVTVKADPAGRVSGHLANAIGRGSIVEVSQAFGDFVLPEDRPQRVLLVSGGSGITPVMSILRTLVDEGAATQVTLLHYARGPADVAFADELAIMGRLPGVDVVVVHTRDSSRAAHELTGYFSLEHVAATIGAAVDVPTYVCGPANLIDAVTGLWIELGLQDELRVERFALAPITPDRDAALDAGGTLSFADSRLDVVATAETILAQAEAAGLTPKSGCRMGICHTCIRPKIAGQVRDVRDGSLSSCDPEHVQICISVPVGDVTIDL